MNRLILASAIALPALAAAPPSALSQVSGGLWEVSGVPGAEAPQRQCVVDVLVLAQYEHRGKTCSRSILSDKDASALIS